MKLEFKQDFDRALRELDGFSERRLRAAMATALTRTAKAVQGGWSEELRQKVDRPTVLTTRAPVIEMATAQTLVAVVSMREQVSNGQPPSQYLQPLEYGGGREHKKFEKALIAQGSMPAGAYALPTDNAKRDAYGNVTRGQLVQILVQLAGGSVRDGYRRVISTSAVKRAQSAIKAGREYVAVLKQTGKLDPGIYARVGNELQMVFSYERSTFYKRQLSLGDRARRTATQVFAVEMQRAIKESAARLKARGS
jgi:hypothetical protein